MHSCCEGERGVQSPINLTVGMFRNMSTDEIGNIGTGWDAMRIRISLGTYKLFYEADGEDVLVRERGEEEERELMNRARLRHEERRRSRWLK